MSCSNKPINCNQAARLNGHRLRIQLGPESSGTGRTFWMGSPVYRFLSSGRLGQCMCSQGNKQIQKKNKQKITKLQSKISETLSTPRGATPPPGVLCNKKNGQLRERLQAYTHRKIFVYVVSLLPPCFDTIVYKFK